MKKIAVLAGDGIGPEVMEEAIKVLNMVAVKHNIDFDFRYADVGGIAYDRHGTVLPEETLQTCKESDAILFGSIGGPKWDALHQEKRVEQSILGIRKYFDFYANLRPAILYPELISSCPLRNVGKSGFDVMIVRELSGDAYFGNKRLEEEFGLDEMKYTKKQCIRIAETAFRIAASRKKHLTCVDKSNALSSSAFFRRIFSETGKKYPNVKLDLMYIDNAAMQLIKKPDAFDVIATTNIFGDILSDEAAMLAGSIGMLPSASINENGFGLYEPSGGSAPDIAGKGIANPIAQILSAALMLRHSFNDEKASNSIEKAVRKTLQEGYRTKDIMEEGMKEANTKEMGALIAGRIK